MLNPLVKVSSKPNNEKCYNVVFLFQSIMSPTVPDAVPLPPVGIP